MNSSTILSLPAEIRTTPVVRTGHRAMTHETSRDGTWKRSRDYSFPPEPKEPYDIRDEDNRSEDDCSKPRDLDQEFGSRNSREED